MTLTPGERLRAEQAAQADPPPSNPSDGGGSGPDYDPDYDPAGHTVADVLAYLEANPDDLERVAALEAEGRNRVGIIAYLEGDEG